MNMFRPNNGSNPRDPDDPRTPSEHPSWPSGQRTSGTIGNGGGPRSYGQDGSHRTFGPDASPPTPRGLGNGAREHNFYEIKRQVQAALIAELDPKIHLTQQSDQISKIIDDLFQRILTQQNIVLGRPERQRMLESIKDDILGFGPIQPLLEDETVTEIMINGTRPVVVEKEGRLHKTDIRFRDDEHVKSLIDRIISPLGRRCDEQSPYVDARLPDGSRVNAVIPPISLIGPVVTIRKFSKRPLQPQDLIQYGTVSQGMLDFLQACVQVKLNIVISGGTGSGKTTLLNVLSGYIPDGERIVTIEDAAELQLQQEHVIPMESRPPNIEGRGTITIRDLVGNALRMRPDRIVVGECRGGEALDMLQAMNTGHDGSLTTLHSNGPRDTLARLETMVLMAGMELPLAAVRAQIASALHIIIHQERMRDGTRKITHVTEVLRVQGDIITMQDLFVYEQLGMENGKVVGRLRPTGLRPSFVDTFEMAGLHLPPSTFGYGEAAWQH